MPRRITRHMANLAKPSTQWPTILTIDDTSVRGFYALKRKHSRSVMSSCMNDYNKYSGTQGLA